MTYYSRRQLEALGEPLGESVTQTKPGGHGRIYGGGGGGGPSSSTTYTSNIPEYLRPQVEALIGGATQEYFDTKPVTTTDPTTGETKTEYQISGIKPFVPYSTNMQDYVAGFSPLQQQAQYEAAGMMRPGQYETGTEFVGQAGMSGLQSARQAMDYGGMGAGYGAEAAGMVPMATDYGQSAADIGRMGLRAESLGRDVGQEAREYARQAAGMGGTYERMATDPFAVQAYMSPYMQNVVEQQKDAAIRDAQKAQLTQNLGAARQGTYGGSRQLLAATERERALGSQLQNIQAQGLQKAYEDALRAQQFGVTTGLQGLQGAQAGLGTALQGGQLGLSGIGQAIAGQQAGLASLGQAGQLYGLGMQGANVGLQGVTGAQAGYGLTGQMGRSLADIGTAQQTADIARMDLQTRLGGAQQAREQQLIDQAIKNYQMAREYPYEQLSRYSGLLRGYYTPTTTQTSYQAPPSAMSQLTGGALTAASIAGLAKKKGGSIKEKKYAKGGIASIDQKVLNDPTSFSPQMINKGIQSGSISEMIGAIGLNQIANAKKQAQQAQAVKTPAPQGTVLGDLQQQVAGIDALPSNLPVQPMAGGGIIAFEDGGAVEPIRFQNQGLVSKTQEERDREAMMDTLRRMKAAGMDILTLPGRGVAGAFESAITRPLRAAGVPMPYLPSSFYGGNAASMFPYYDQIRKEDAEKAAAQPTSVPAPDARIPPSATAPAPGATPGATAPSQGRGQDQGIASPAATKLPAAPTGSAFDVTKDVLEGRPDTATGERMGGYFQRSEEREKRLMEALGKDRLQGQAFGEYEKALKKEGEQAGLDKDQAKYMSLLKAGLSMMAGTSRHALENIGKGALVGAEDYQAAYKDLRRAERERTKEFALIEQARRAEARDDLKRRDELLMRASDAAQKRDEFGTQAMINSGIEDTRAARDVWKTQYAGGVQMRGQDITLQAARERANALANRSAGLTPAQLGRFRENAMRSIDQNAIRAQIAKEAKLSKVPAPGADATFDKRVNEAYEKAIADYIQRVLGGGTSGGGVPQGFTLIPPGAED